MFQVAVEQLKIFFDTLQNWGLVKSTEFEKLYNAKSATEAVFFDSQEKLLALQRAKRDMEDANIRINA